MPDGNQKKGVMNFRVEILTATIISVAIHCVITVLLLTHLHGALRAPLPATFMVVDMHTVVAAEKRKTPASLPPRRVWERRLPIVAVGKTPAATPPYLPTFPPQGKGLPIAAARFSGEVGKEAEPKEAAMPGAATTPPAGSGGNTTVSASTVKTVELRPGSPYLAGLRALIEQRKEYPALARKGGMEGTVCIGCLLSRKGELKTAAIVRSSGHRLLDAAALRTIRGVGEFPAVPPEIKGDFFSFVAPITYQLE